jgi:NADPH-dependent 2,4-dienoyl-CoA reductase/sulfur reductase-like enzyme
MIATGSAPVKPRWLIGADLQKVFVIPKEREYLDDMVRQLDGVKNIAVVGAGFIGVEPSDELNKRGLNVTLIEKLPHILSLAFDVELSEIIHEMLNKRGIRVLTGIPAACPIHISSHQVECRKAFRSDHRRGSYWRARGR